MKLFKDFVAPIAGGVAGFFLGGPVGAAIGAGIGGSKSKMGALRWAAIGFGAGLVGPMMGSAFTGTPGIAAGATEGAAGATAATEGTISAASESMASAYLSGGTEAAVSEAGKTLVADAATSGAGATTDVTAGLLNEAAQAPAKVLTSETGAFDMGQFTPADMGAAGPAAANNGGIISSAMKYAKDNPLLALGALNLAGGVVKGIGQSQLQKDLMERQYAQEVGLQEWKRRFTQGGSYFDANVNVKPAANKTLRRSDGTPVHGIVAGTMRG